MKRFTPLLLLALTAPAFAAVELTESTTVALLNGTTQVSTHSSLQACQTEARRLANASTATSGSVTYTCQSRIVASYTPSCTTPRPANETRAQSCASGTTGSWQQTRSYTSAAYPTCWSASAWAPAQAPAGACAASGGTGPKVTLSLASTSYKTGGYTTILWSSTGAQSCTASASPAYSVWSGTKQLSWSQSVAPKVSTTFSLTCKTAAGATTTATAALTVNGATPPAPTPPTPTPPTPTPPTPPTPTPPTPTPPTPTPPTPGTPPSSGELGAMIGTYQPFNAADPVDVAFSKFAETASGNFAFEGHSNACATGGACPYRSTWDQNVANLNSEEPWLFDRATTFAKLYGKTGNTKWRDLAINMCRDYYSHIRVNQGNLSGFFDLSSYASDVKYSYTDCAVWYEKLTNSQEFRPQVEAIYQMTLREWPATYSTSTGFWTERHHAYALGAALGRHALYGDAASLARARALFEVVNNMAASTGAPVHPVEQHEGDSGDRRMMVSPWMSALLVEYLQTYYRFSNDARVLTYLSRYTDFLVANCLYDGGVESPELRGRLMPWYLCGVGADYEDQRGWGDMEHALDVSGVIAHGIAAKRALGEDPTAALNAYRQLRDTGIYTLNYWTRTEPTLPKYRLTPPRKFNWWFGSTYDSSYLAR